jgi:hypothetical protein
MKGDKGIPVGFGISNKGYLLAKLTICASRRDTNPKPISNQAIAFTLLD